jgi:hypothetical protein
MNATTRFRLGMAALVGLVIIGDVPSVRAEEVQDTGSETIQDRRACTPDVMHLCRAFIPIERPSPIAWSRTSTTSAQPAGP